MFLKIKLFFFWISFIIFLFLITKNYFSEQNVIFINKSRSSYSEKSNKNTDNLPILKSDTSNIIVYKNDLDEFKKKRKERFWEKLINNLDE